MIQITSVSPLSHIESNGNRFTVNWDFRAYGDQTTNCEFSLFVFVGNYEKVITYDFMEENITDMLSHGNWVGFKTFDWTPTQTSYSITGDLDSIITDGLFSGKSKSTIISEIYRNKRVLYFFVNAEVDGIGKDSMPVIVLPFAPNAEYNAENPSYIAAYSTKSQVLNDVFYEEGEMVWGREYIGANFSRTAVDSKGLYTNDSNRACVWVTDRNDECRVVKYDLLTGDHYGDAYLNGEFGGYGARGITVDANTGDAIVGASTTTESNQKFPLIRVHNNFNDRPDKYTVECANTDNRIGVYGLTPGYYNDRKNNVYYGVNANNKSGICLWKRGHAPIYNIGRGEGEDNVEDYSGYGITTAPDGTVWGTSSGNTVPMKFIYNAHRDMKFDYYEVTNTKPWGVDGGNNGNTRGICSCNEVWDYTSTGKRLLSYEMWACSSDAEWEKIYRYKVTPTGDRSELITLDSNGDQTNLYNPNISVERLGDIVLHRGGSWDHTNWNNFGGIGEDGDNNMWIIERNYNDNIFKFYTGVAHTAEFPNGGFCRYPTCSYRSYQENGGMNDKLIEYVLTREISTSNPDMPESIIESFNSKIGNMAYPSNRTWSENIKASDTGSMGRRVYTKGDGYEGTTPTMYNGLTITRDLAKAWYDEAKAVGLDEIMGKRLYKYFSLTAGEIDFYYYPYTKFTSGYTSNRQNMCYVYSDFTGHVAANTASKYKEFDVMGPDIVESTCVSFMLTGVDSEPRLIDGGKWTYDSNPVYPENIQSGSTIYSDTSGYDDLYCLYNLKVDINHNELDHYDINFGDGGVITRSPNLESYDFDHTYMTPSKIGLPANISAPYKNPLTLTTMYPGRKNRIGGGVYNIDATAYFDKELYTGEAVYCVYPKLHAVVYERWPTAQFTTHVYDMSSERRPINWGSWGGGIYNLKWSKGNEVRPVHMSTGDSSMNNEIITGTDPLSAVLDDNTIIRSYPLTALEFTIDKVDSWDTGVVANNVYEAGVHFDNYHADTVDTRIGIINSLPVFRYGTYNITLTAMASSSTWSPNTFTQTISVKEFEPFANFWAVKAETVPSDYEDETFNVKASDLISEANAELNLEDVEREFFFSRGYAPNMTVTFLESSDPHTFPISAYMWNFGDYYAGSENHMVCSTDDPNDILEGEFTVPNWKTTLTNHEVIHTYTMPGTYDVTLSVEASTTMTSDICAKYVEIDRFSVYVEEIPPQCCFSHSEGGVIFTKDVIDLTGTISPKTMYYIASGTKAGSFPIGKLEYDFGDGSDNVIVRRLPVTQTYLDGDDVINIRNDHFINGDDDDPRNMVVQHTFTSFYTSSSFTVSMSAYASNTNTSSNDSDTNECVRIIENLEPLPLPDTPEEPRHLIKNRFIDDDLMLVFEGEGGAEIERTAYNVVLKMDDENDS